MEAPDMIDIRKTLHVARFAAVLAAALAISACAKNAEDAQANAAGQATPGSQQDFVVNVGDRVFFEPGEEHWHGATPSRFMMHIAMLQVDDEGNSATWGDHVTDEEYGAVSS